MCEPRNRDNGASDVWALTAYKPPPWGLARWAVSAIFEKITFRDLTAFFSFLMRENLVFSDILIKEY